MSGGGISTQRNCICRQDGIVCAYHQTKKYHDEGRCWGKPQCPFCNGDEGYER